MCGIAGWVDWQRDLTSERRTVDAMTGSMACRGPDEQGVWVTPRIALGHRRLAVIDVAGGGQPMTVADHCYGGARALTFSGEIYNFTELRAELESHGHRFETRSDTEVLLHSYLQWGADCAARLNGMFAFALWDESKRELILARDRLGVKPLYYYPYRDGLLFGSEPKALLANPLFSAEVDASGLAELFANFGGHTPGHGIYRHLRELRGGQLARIDERGLRIQTYWQLESHPHHDTEAATRQRVRELLNDAVRRQLVADVPLCVLVSGGLDSSAISALAAKSYDQEKPEELATYAVDFRDSGHSFVSDAARPERDAPYVAELVRCLGSNHTDVTVDTNDLFGAQRRATRARDLPCLGDLDGSLYLLFQAIRERSTVALSGESADEVFGGYPWFHDPEAVGRRGFPWVPHDSGLANVLAPEIRERIQPADYLAQRYSDALNEVPRLHDESGHERRMREISYLALTRYLPMLLARKDRTSMAVGLEVRVPFCDHRLVEYVWNVPWSMKSADGIPKSLLRSAVSDLLPAGLAWRPKSMFPAAVDPAYESALGADIRRLLNTSSALTPLLDTARVLALLEGRTQQPPWMRRLALAYLLQVDRWLDEYKVRVAV